MSRYAVFDSFIDVIFGVDTDGKVFYGNSAASNLFGVSGKRLANGRPVNSLISIDPDPFPRLKSEVRSDEATKLIEIKFTLPSGGSGSGQLLFQPEPACLSDSGEEQGNRWIAYLRDVSLEKTLHEKYRGELAKQEQMIIELRAARAAVEAHSKDLENIVNERTKELSGTNRMLKTILDSLGQGILVFDRNGICLPIYSQVCLRLLAIDPSGKKIEDVLKLKATARKNFELWRGAVFDQLLDFEDMVPLTLRRLSDANGSEISLDYCPMYDPEGALTGIVLVTTDRTTEMRALRKAEKERALVNKVTQVARNREAFRMFTIDGQKLMSDLKHPESLDLVEVARRLHTLKGGAATFSLTEIVDTCHHLEDDLKANADKDRLGFNQFLRLKAEQLLIGFEQEIKMLSDLLGPFSGSSGASIIELPTSRLREWSEALLSAPDLAGIREIGIEIQKFGEKSVGSAIQHIEASLIELAKSRGKILKAFAINGGELKIPEDFAQALLVSLVHAFRNSVYHGIEDPHERSAVGKSEGGQIAVNIRKLVRGEQEWLKIDIEDDGRGVNPQTIRARLVKLGHPDLAEQSDEKVIQTILRDDFSTLEKADSVSGRGVGMAAISAEVRRLGGSVEVISTVGMGMTLKISVPFPRADRADGSQAS